MTKNFINKIFATACLAIIVTTGNAHAEGGRVIEKDTGTPIAGAFVITRWQGQGANPVHGNTICYHAQITVTNQQGEFGAPKFSGNVNPMITDRLRYSYVYVPGYREVERADPSALVIPVERRTRGAAIEFSEIWRVRPPFNCRMSDKALLPLIKAMHQELNALAATSEQRTQANGLLFEIESIEFGDEIADANSIKRKRELKQRESRP